MKENTGVVLPACNPGTMGEQRWVPGACEPVSLGYLACSRPMRDLTSENIQGCPLLSLMWKYVCVYIYMHIYDYIYIHMCMYECMCMYLFNNQVPLYSPFIKTQYKK